MKKALCVGISRFRDPYVSQLAGAANDAVLLATMLQRQYGFTAADVRLLTDESATRSAVIGGLVWLTAGAAPGDVLVFTLATHGTRAIDRNAPPGPLGEAGGNEKIFQTYDCSTSNYLLRDDVAAALDRAPTGANCYCIIDTCDIGPFYYSARLDAAEEDRPPTGSSLDIRFQNNADMDRRAGGPSLDNAVNRVEITGCADHQRSFDMAQDTGSHGLFTYALYHTLERHTWDLTVSTFYAELTRQVTTLADSMKVKQTPQLRAPQRLMHHQIFR